MIGYLYDASGHRVAEGTITSMSCDPSKNGFTTTTQEKDYILDQSGAVETVLTMAQGGAMQWDHSNIYAKGELVGAYTQTGLHFYLHDWQGTVRNYLSEAISKLGAANRVEAARLARSKGWL